MALSLQHFYQKTHEKYHVTLATPDTPLDQTITWVYMMEDVNNLSFIRGGELVITTGLVSTDEETLLNMTKESKRNGACGIGFFLGRYVSTLSDTLIDWCTTHQFPAFIIPWEVPLVDLMQYYCEKILSEQQEQVLMGSVLFSALTGNLSPDEKSHLDAFTNGHLIASKSALQMASFAHAYVEGIHYYLCRSHIMPKRYEVIGVSNPIGPNANWPGIRAQAMRALKTAFIRSLSMMHYRDIGLYNVALSVKDPQVFYEAKNRLSALTDVTTRLVFRTYLEQAKSVQKTADLLFLHRNTVNYHVGKAKRLLSFSDTGNDLTVLLDFYLVDCMPYVEM